jgi:transcriptional repressor NrdR
MRCPYCKEDQDKVIDSRSSEAGRIIRRRRECLACSRRFTTYEKIGESFKLSVVKKDKSRVPYDREKVVTGLQKACYKRPVSAEQIQEIADKIEEDIFKCSDKEVTSAFIGESVMKHLKNVDKVAYIRFASVYRDFKTGEKGVCPICEAKVVDTCGAGDAFFSGAVSALMNGKTLGEAVIRGTHTAALIVSTAENTLKGCKDILFTKDGK